MGVRVTSPVNATFIHMKKTGGTSVTRWLLQNTESFKFNKHAELPYVKKRFKDHGILITVVRNPFDRLISWYHYYIKKTKARISAVNNGYKIKNSKKMQNKYNLEKNTKILEKYNEIGFNGFARNCNFGLQLYNAKQCDIVLQLENINEDFKQVQDLFGIDVPLPHTNRSSHRGRSELYDEETKEIVYEKYAKDFDYFGYTFDDK